MERVEIGEGEVVVMLRCMQVLWEGPDDGPESVAARWLRAGVACRG